MLTLNSIKQTGVLTKEVTLLSLDVDTTTQILTDSINSKSTLNDKDQLAQLCFQKMQGNPFFVKMFLRYLLGNPM